MELWIMEKYNEENLFCSQKRRLHFNIQISHIEGEKLYVQFVWIQKTIGKKCDTTYYYSRQDEPT